jgi:hypothetical protein
VLEWLADAATLHPELLTRTADRDRATAERALETGTDSFDRDASQSLVTRMLWEAELTLDPELCERVTALLTDRERAKLAHDIDCIRRPHPLVVGPPSDHHDWSECSNCGTRLDSDDATLRIGGRPGFASDVPFSEPPEEDPHYCLACVSVACEAMRAARNS